MIQAPNPGKSERGDEGYLLLGLVVVCFILALLLGIAAPRIAEQLERDREVESEHRGEEYIRAIQLYYRRNHNYPTSVEQLLGTANGGGISLGGSAANVKYLRQKYVDPITGGEYRLIHFGEAQTEVKGFFGEPLQGPPAGNLGSAAGMVSSFSGNGPGGTAGTGTSAGGPGSAVGISGGAAPAAGLTGGAGAAGDATAPAGATSAATQAAGGTTGAATAGASAGQSATTFQGSKGAIVGVGSNGKGHGLVEWNGSEDISQWEFLYDPRVELLKAKVSLFGGTPAASGTGSLGSGFAPISGATGLGSSTNTTSGAGTSTNDTSTTPATGSSGANGGNTVGVPILP